MSTLPILRAPLDDVKEADILGLVDNSVVERRSIEYKQALPGPTDADKKEFLADASSFANAAGGLLLYGVPANNGAPVRPVGLKTTNPDGDVLRLENMMQAGVSPRIPGVSVRAIPLQNGGYVIALRIPRSWALPHRVVYQGHDKFYSRNSAGKYPLDVSELRAAFLASESTGERVRAFRSARIGSIIAGEGPVPLADGPKMILQLVPFTAFDPSARHDLELLTADMGLLQPIGDGFNHQRFNLEGLMTYDTGSEGKALGYLLVFKNGCVEAVAAGWWASKDRLYVPVDYERHLLKALPRYFEIQRRLGVQPPIVVILTLHSIRGYTLITNNPFPFGSVQHPIDRDTLAIPEVIVEDPNLEPSTIMRPLFDAVWNAAGRARSMNYDADGRWVGQP